MSGQAVAFLCLSPTPFPVAEERLDLVEVFFADTALRSTLQQELRHVPDFHRLARKMKMGKSSLQVSAILLCVGLTPPTDPSH